MALPVLLQSFDREVEVESAKAFFFLFLFFL
jgi:hypothetical protein